MSGADKSNMKEANVTYHLCRDLKQKFCSSKGSFLFLPISVRLFLAK